MLTTTASFQLISRDLQRSLDTTATQPQVSRESAYYLENITSVKSVDDFIGNDRVFAFAMKAFGLEDMTYAKAYMKKVLKEGVDDQQSFANQITDVRFREFAEAFNFERYGETATAFDRTQSGTVDRYVRQTLEESAGADNQGVRLALYFQRKVGEIENAFDILGDRALLQVARTALGLSEQIATLDIDKQAELLGDRLDIESLSDPAELEQFLNRFTTLWELENPTAPPTVPNVLAARPTVYGIGPDLLLNLASLNRGGR
ncbi:MAG: DUF1217 domain-containing protein [Aestuariivirgaceae bacterium]